MQGETIARSPRGRFKWPFGIVGATATLWDRFWSKVDMSGGPDACWPYRGYLRRRRRGRRGKMQVGGRGSAYVSADRLALALATDGNLNRRRHGNKLQCCHRCGNGDDPIQCVNPRHTYWGTQAQNEKDKKRAAARAAAAVLAAEVAARWTTKSVMRRTADTLNAAAHLDDLKRANALAVQTPEHVIRHTDRGRRRVDHAAHFAARDDASGAGAANDRA